jgi:3-deoxy-7-phosphoheptulonate synthase
MRTAALDGAHVEYFRGIRNPVGIKVGPGMSQEWLVGLLETLNPAREAGRMVLIHRMGESQIEAQLPGLIKAVQDTGSPVLWICDPMHGNTESTASGIKTRRFRKIMHEVELAFDIHRDCHSKLGGVHLELTGENVTECTGGARDLSDDDLKLAYKYTVDPRLNYEQSLELAMLIVRNARRKA